VEVGYQGREDGDVLHNILRSDAAEKCGKDSMEDEYLRMVDPMAVPLVYVLVAFSIGKTDEEKHALQGAEELTSWCILGCEIYTRSRGLRKEALSARAHWLSIAFKLRRPVAHSRS